MIKIATYNVNGVNGRLPVLIRWLREEQPDIVCLQELKAPQEKFPESALNNEGYNAVWYGQKSWNGVAILARDTRIELVHRAFPGEAEGNASRYIEAIIRDIRIGCLYLPNGNPAPGPKYDYKLDWIGALLVHAKKLLALQEPVVLCGDYNIIPEEIDAYKPERWVEDALFRPEVRQAYRKLLKAGWTDAIRSLYPEETVYTFFDYFRNSFARNAGLRIDHFLLNPSLAKRLSAGGVSTAARSWEKTSDHAPVWITVKNK